MLACIQAFAQGMRSVCEHLAQAEKRHYDVQKSAWFLGAVEVYWDAVKSLAQALCGLPIRAAGFVAFRDYLTQYVSSAQSSLIEETKSLKDDLAAVRYCVLVNDGGLSLRGPLPPRSATPSSRTTSARRTPAWRAASSTKS